MTHPSLNRSENVPVDSQLIPVPDRYGYCESPTCRGKRQVTAQKPKFVVDGTRLCAECAKRVAT